MSGFFGKSSSSNYTSSNKDSIINDTHNIAYKFSTIKTLGFLGFINKDSGDVYSSSGTHVGKIINGKMQ